jgi:hypothetical protein
LATRGSRREGFINTVEARVLQRIESVFVRCPELFRFSVRDRSGLPDHIDPTKLEGDLFIFEIALAPRLGKAQYDEVYVARGQRIATGQDVRPLSALTRARALR